jgi:hypothetical protein
MRTATFQFEFFDAACLLLMMVIDLLALPQALNKDTTKSFI